MRVWEPCAPGAPLAVLPPLRHPSSPTLAFPRDWGLPQVTPMVSFHSSGLWSWASPHGQGKTPRGNCAPQTQFGGLVPVPEHPTHPTAVPLGPYLSAWCGSGGYGRSRGCATRPGHFMGRQGPAARGAGGSGHPTGHLPVQVRTLHLPSISCCHLIYLIFFFFYCHQELTKHRAEHPRPSSPLVGPASSSGITPERSHLSPSVLGEAKTPGDDFPSSRGWVCSFLSAV